MTTSHTQEQPNASQIMAQATVNTLFFLALFGFLALFSAEPTRPTPVEPWHLFAGAPLLGLWAARWQLPYLTQYLTMQVVFVATVIAFLMLWHDYATSSYLLFTAAIIFSMKARHQPKD